ncbi:MAG: hypothetical protein ACRDLT_09665 [Solirubrobacteraceae bacterium]
MAVIDRPAQAERTSEPVVPDAIFPEARRRGRRRRAFSALAALTVLGALVGAVVVVLQGARTGPTAAQSRLSAVARGKAGRVPAPLVAWGDYSGVLYVGDVATGRLLQIATYPVPQSSSAGPLAINHGRLLWVDAKNRIRGAEIATGRSSVIARGFGVTSSPDGDRLYVDQGTTDFLEMDARTMRVTRRVAIPVGWTANPWVARTFSGGLLLTHTGRGAVLGYWRPGSRVRPLGPSIDQLGVYTPSSGRYSLLAWLPRCTKDASFDSHCPLAITNTATGRTMRIPSPTRYSFTGGAFSPNGNQFATFANTDNPSDPLSTPRSELAIINTRTGVLRLGALVRIVSPAAISGAGRNGTGWALSVVKLERVHRRLVVGG